MKSILILMTGIFLTYTSATAQLYRAQSSPAPVRSNEAERAMESFSKCLLRTPSRERSVMDYLQLPNDDPEQEKRGDALTTSGCVPAGTAQMRFQAEMFRYSLFSALYNKYFEKTRPEDFGNIEKLNYSLEFNQVRAPVSTIELAVRNFGDCVARKNPVNVHALLLTRVHTDSEKNAISQLMPDLSVCLSDGVELKFSRTVIRGILAEAMYKLRMAPIASPFTEVPE